MGCLPQKERIEMTYCEKLNRVLDVYPELGASLVIPEDMLDEILDELVLKPYSIDEITSEVLRAP